MFFGFGTKTGALGIENTALNGHEVGVLGLTLNSVLLLVYHPIPPRAGFRLLRTFDRAICKSEEYELYVVESCDPSGFGSMLDAPGPPGIVSTRRDRRSAMVVDGAAERR